MKAFDWVYISLLGLMATLPLFEFPKTVFFVLLLVSWLGKSWEKSDWGGPWKVIDSIFLFWLISIAMVSINAKVSHDYSSGGFSDIFRYITIGWVVSRSSFKVEQVKNILLVTTIATVLALLFSYTKCPSGGSCIELNSVGHVNHSALYVVLNFAVIISFLKYFNKKLIAFYVLCSLFFIWGVFDTHSRAAAGVLVVVSVVTIAAWLIQKRSVKCFAGVMVVILIILSFCYVSPPEVWNKHQAWAAAHSQTDSPRAKIRRFAYYAFRSNPVLGVGFGNFSRLEIKDVEQAIVKDKGVVDSSQYLPFSHAHNIFYTYLVSGGVLLGSVFLAYWLWLGYLLYRQRKTVAGVSSGIKLAALNVILINLIAGWANTTFHHETAILSVVFISLFIGMDRNKKTTVGIKKVGIYQRLAAYVVIHWPLFLVSFVGYGLYAGTQPLFAMLIEHIIDTLNSVGKEGMLYLPLLFIGLFFIRGVGSFLGNYFLARISGNVIHQLRCEIFNKYTTLPTSYFDAHNSGHMLSRITHNVGEVTRATTNSVRAYVREGLTALGLLGYLTYINWQLSLVFLVIAPIIAVMVSYVSKRLKKLSKRMQDSVGDMTQIASEVVVGHKTVRSFGGEEYERNRFETSSLDNRRQNLKLITTVSINNPLIQFIVSLALAALMYLALLMMKDVGAGEFVAYLTAAFLLPKPVRQLSDAHADIQRGVAAAETLFEVLDEGVEKDEGDYEIGRVKGEIEFKDVNFGYSIGGKVLKGIDFKINAGETVALVGLSGGGKTSLVNLLPRFYEYSSGSILIDGVDIREFKLENLRKQIAMVSQNVILFGGSVESNIRYGASSGESRNKVIRAAKAAYAHEFIENIPGCYDAEIGENGAKLSGGQRQRIAIARALLKDAPILIMDEATSALDTESERYIQAALDGALKNRTTLIIAHRLSTVEKADMILVMDNGEIIERGRHKDLIGLNGVYASLHGMGFKESLPG